MCGSGSAREPGLNILFIIIWNHRNMDRKKIAIKKSSSSGENVIGEKLLSGWCVTRGDVVYQGAGLVSICLFS